MKRILTMCALCGCLATAASAQDKMTGITYTISFPGTETKDFIQDASFRGVELMARMAPGYGKPFMLGLQMGWEVFDQSSSETVALQHGAVTGNQHRYVNAFPFMLTGHYYLGSPSSTRAFAGVGVGTVYALQTFQIGVFSFEEGNWHLAVAPEIGIQHPYGASAEIYLSGRYAYAFKSGGSLKGDEVAWDYWSINAGVAWAGW